MDKSTVVATLLAAAAHGRGGLRFLDRAERETFHPWPEILERARAAAGRLQRLGIAPGDRVAIVLPTGVDFFDAYFGIQLAGAVPVPLYPPVRLGRLDEYHRQTAAMLEAAGARLLLTERRLQLLLGETVERARPELGCARLVDLPERSFREVAVAPGDLGLVQFSSGTTVDPKPVALSHRALMAQVRVLNALWPERDGVAVTGVSWLPLYHDMGLIGCVLPAMDLPSEMTLIGPEVFVTRPAVWLRAISRYRAFISPAPNFAYGLCVTKVRDDELAGVDLSSWRAALNGAEAIAPGVARAFIERFAPFGLRPEALTPVYGLSEAALAVTFSALDRPFRSERFDRHRLADERRAVPAADGQEIVSLGRPLAGFSLRVVGPEGAEQPEGRVGRVWITGPSLMEGYLGRPEATARALVDGWLDTGDLGFLWQGELYLTGRAKDVLILRGRNYAPDLVEHAVDGLPGLRTGCAVAVSWLPEGAEGEVLALFLEAHRDSSEAQLTALPEAARQAVLGATGLAVDEVVLVAPGTLPRTSSGKLRRAETLKRHRAGELEPPAAVTALRLAGSFARSGLAWARLKVGGGRRG
ncbi:MAG TPA: fatty acyl-AMP ligase [Thermoanaerobaculia bacterium]|nr:fatty acyl-AMP ligase [Thermoanaerobaculia bacterium]